MANNRTFTELNGDIITNGIYSVRYVMENDSPRFVLSDIFKSLFYKTPYQMAYIFRKALGLGKVINERNQLVIYVNKEEADKVFDHLYLITSEFREFWKNEVIPATDAKYAELRTKVSEAQEENHRLTEIFNTLNEENDALTAKIEHLIAERKAIAGILGTVA